MEGKIVIVTGSNTGIGKETARGLAKMGATVVMACRDPQKAEAARAEVAASAPKAEVVAMPLDLGSKQSIRAFAKAFADKYGKLDVLVNNAGVWPTARGTTADGRETTWGTNHVGTHLLTMELLPLLKAAAPSRVVVLSSKLHYRGKIDWEDLEYEKKGYSATAAYNQSKLANVMFTKALARRLEGTGVTVNAVHPGVVTTELARGYPKLLVKIFHLFTITAEEGAKTSIHVATAPELAQVTGEYFEECKAKPAAKASLDVEAQERLWKLTEALVA